MERRIYGIETEFGVTCTSQGRRRLTPDEVARYMFRSVVRWGRSSNVFLGNGARLYLDVGSHPEYATAECDDLLDLVASRRALALPLEGAEDYLAAEVVYAVTHEGARHLDDVLTRRTRISIETFDRGVAAAPAAARLMADELGWDAERVHEEVDHYLRRVEAERRSQLKATDQEADEARVTVRDIV